MVGSGAVRRRGHCLDRGWSAGGVGGDGLLEKDRKVVSDGTRLGRPKKKAKVDSGPEEAYSSTNHSCSFSLLN
jgi:hypothetical protein